MAVDSSSLFGIARTLAAAAPRLRAAPALVAAVVAALSGCGAERSLVDGCDPSVQIVLAPPAITLSPGMTVTFQATTITCDGRKVNLAWSSSNASVAEIVSASDSDAVVRGVANGVASISVRAVGSPSLPAEAVLTVIPIVNVPLAGFAVRGNLVDPAGDAVAGARVVLRPVMHLGGVPRDTVGACSGLAGGAPLDTLVSAADGSFAGEIGTARFELDGCLVAEATPPPGSALAPIIVSGASFHSSFGPARDTVRLHIVLPRGRP